MAALDRREEGRRPHGSAMKESVTEPSEAGGYEIWGGLLGLSGVAILAFLLPPLDTILEGHEALHHLQHAVTFLFSFVAGLSLYRLLQISSGKASGWLERTSQTLLVIQHRADPRGIFAILFAATIVAFWHIPYFFNLAVVDHLVHIVEHLCFALAGGAVGFALHSMGKWTRLGSLLVAELSMLLFAVFLVVFQLHVYQVYPREHEFVFGIGMIYTMMPLMVYTVYRFLVEQVS